MSGTLPWVNASEREAYNNVVGSQLVNGTTTVGDLAFISPGTTFPRTLEDRFSDEVTPQDFTDPDRTTDWAAAFQAAVNTGKPIFVPPGTYTISTAINAVNGKLRIRGKNATITSSDATFGRIFLALNVTLTDLDIRDLTLTTTRNDLIVRGGGLIQIDYTSVDQGHIENVTFDTASSFQNCIALAAQNFNNSTNISIVNNRFTGCSAGIEVFHDTTTDNRITYLTISGNTFKHNGLKDDQVAGFAISLAGTHRYITVSDNIITGYPYAGIEVASSSANTMDYTINGNRITDTGRGIIFDGTNLPIRFARMSIVGNVIKGNRFFQSFEYLTDSVISGNIVDIAYTVASADHQFGMISFQRGDRNTVSGNTFKIELPASEYNKSFLLFMTWADCVFTGNQVKTTGVDTVRLGDGTATVVTRNVFSGNAITLAPSDVILGGFYPFNLNGSAVTANTIIGNHVTTTTGLIFSETTGNAKNVMVNNTILRSDTGRVMKGSFAAYNVTSAALDLTREIDLPGEIRLQGNPGVQFTVTLPSLHYASYQIYNNTNFHCDVLATSGGVSIPLRGKASVSIEDGFVGLNGYPDWIGVSGDIGDVNYTANARSGQPILRFATALTANRTVTLPGPSLSITGDWFRVVRTGLGAFTMDVGPGIKTIPASTQGIVEVGWDASGPAWRLVNYSQWT